MTVKTLAAIAAISILLAESAAAEAPVWMVDAKASAITFGAKQMQVSVPGRFTRFTATIRFDPADLAGSKVSIDIDVASVSTPNRDIEDEIKREPWFDVARHPTARFEATVFKHQGGDRYDLNGQLRLRGLTKPITVPATIRIADDPGLPGSLQAKASGDVKVSRTAFGIGQGQWRDVAVVSDEVTIHFEFTARRPKTGG
jgi:polyisoprenoid-binding protein YceI